MFFDNTEFAVSAVTRIKSLVETESHLSLDMIVRSLAGSVKCHLGLSLDDFNEYVEAYKEGDSVTVAEISFIYPEPIFWLIDRILHFVYIDRFKPQEIVDQLLKIDFNEFYERLELEYDEVPDRMALLGSQKAFFDNVTGLVALAADPESGMTKPDLIEKFVDLIVAHFDEININVISNYLAAFLANNVHDLQAYHKKYPDLSCPVINRILSYLYSPKCNLTDIRDWVCGWQISWLPETNETFCAAYK